MAHKDDNLEKYEHEACEYEHRHHDGECGCHEEHEHHEHEHHHHHEECECHEEHEHHEHKHHHHHHDDECGCHDHHHYDHEGHHHHCCDDDDDDGCCCCGHDHEHGEERGKADYIRVICEAVLTGVVMIFHQIPDWAVLIAYLLLGYDVLWSSVKKIPKGKFFDEEFLMSIATIGAICIGDYREACAVMFFYKLGELIGDITADKCRSSIKAMFDFAPDSARRITESGYEIVKPEDLKINDRIAVFAGEKIPCDGFVYSGESYTDTSSLTGESLPVKVSDGSKVMGGTINTEAPIEVRITKEYSDSSIAKVVKMLEESSKHKAKSERFMTAFAKKYTPTVVILAILAAVIMSFIPGIGVKRGIYTALLFLVVSCPCSLVISVPLTLFAGVGRASKNKILFKGNSSLENLHKIKNFAFDKTGTLTSGKFTISENTISDEDFNLLAQLERLSTHPLAAVVAEQAKAPYLEAKGITELKGMGIAAEFSGKKVAAGNAKLLELYKIKGASKVSGTVIYLAIDGEYRGYVKLSDNMKKESKDVIAALQSVGAKTAILSGDNEQAVKNLADNIGIKNYYAGLLPEDKVRIAKELKEKEPLAYVGDGINDAPVLAMADIGISMGGAGSDIAIANSDIILLDDSLKSLKTAVDISKKTMGIVYQNVVFSIAVKALVMLLGVLGFTNMYLAVFADVGVMILAVLNAVRAMR